MKNLIGTVMNQANLLLLVAVANCQLKAMGKACICWLSAKYH
jgi:hypothetical protein